MACSAGSDLSLACASAVTPLDDGTFRAHLPDGWALGGRPHGGFLLAVAARAALRASERPHPHVVSASFVRSPECGEVTVSVDLIRHGRAITFAQSTMTQDGRVVMTAQVLTGEPEDARPDWLDAHEQPPAPYAACVPAPHRPGRTGLSERFDIRYDPGAAPNMADGAGARAGAGQARVRGWVEFRDGGAPDALAALVAADALAPSVFPMGKRGWAPTVHMTVYVRSGPAPGPLAVSVGARLVAGQWFDEAADVYDARGALVAQARQLALTPVRPYFHS